jgi:hypothetical protein
MLFTIAIGTSTFFYILLLLVLGMSTDTGSYYSLRGVNVQNMPRTQISGAFLPRRPKSAGAAARPNQWIAVRIEAHHRGKKQSHRASENLKSDVQRIASCICILVHA